MKNYHQLPEISNSDLSIAKSLLTTGSAPKYPQKAFSLGTAVHTYILERKKYIPEPEHHEKVVQLERNLKRYTEIYKMIRYNKKREQVHFFQLEDVPCRAKIDLYSVGAKHLFDLKTTSAKTQKEFENAIQKFEYDRQMAFYAQAVETKKITIIAISKTTDKIFTSSFGLDSFEFREGLKKAQVILRAIKKHNMFDAIYQAREANK